MVDIMAQFSDALSTVLLLTQRIGYLAASQSFHEGTDVLMLTTNMIRKVAHSTFTTQIFTMNIVNTSGYFSLP